MGQLFNEQLEIVWFQLLVGQFFKHWHKDDGATSKVDYAEIIKMSNKLSDESPVIGSQCLKSRSGISRNATRDGYKSSWARSMPWRQPTAICTELIVKQYYNC